MSVADILRLELLLIEYCKPASRYQIGLYFRYPIKAVFRPVKARVADNLPMLNVFKSLTTTVGCDVVMGTRSKVE